MKQSLILWTIVFLILFTLIFSVFFKKRKNKIFDSVCGPGKVCTLYPDQINDVIAEGRNIVMFFYSPSCDTSKKIKPMFERLCTKVNDTVFCQIQCDKQNSESGTVKVFNNKNLIFKTSKPNEVEQFIDRLRLRN